MHRRVEKFKMLEGRETREVTLGGSGGFKKNKFGSLTSFTFGGHEFKDVAATFSPADDAGAFADQASLGTIGGPLLKKFLMVLDYPHDRIALVSKAEEPAKQTGKEADQSAERARDTGGGK